MPGTTPKFAIPYPVLGETADVPRDIKAAVERVEAVMWTGRCFVPTEEARTNVAYGLLPTPDRVPAVVVPTGGLLEIAYSAEMKHSVGIDGFAAIFIGANQLKFPGPGTAAPDPVQAQVLVAGSNQYTKVTSCAIGLMSRHIRTAVGNFTQPAYTGDVTTGQTLATTSLQQTAGGADYIPTQGGGFCVVEVAAGTYDISVQYKATSGTVSARNRKLYVRVPIFAA